MLNSLTSFETFSLYCLCPIWYTSGRLKRSNINPEIGKLFLLQFLHTKLDLKNLYGILLRCLSKKKHKASKEAHDGIYGANQPGPIL